MAVKIADKWYECSVCKSKYLTSREAEKCERSHRVRSAEIGDI